MSDGAGSTSAANGPLHAALTELKSIAERLTGLEDHVAVLSEGARGSAREYQSLGNRHASLDRRSRRTDPDLGQLRAEIQHVSESLKELRERVRTQGTIIWTLEQMLREQVGKMETQLTASLSQMTTELESVRRALKQQPDTANSRREAAGATEAERQSLDQRLDNQAKAIESVLSVVRSQSEAWGQIAAATAPFGGLLKEVTEEKDASADSSRERLNHRLPG